MLLHVNLNWSLANKSYLVVFNYVTHNGFLKIFHKCGIFITLSRKSSAIKDLYHVSISSTIKNNFMQLNRYRYKKRLTKAIIYGTPLLLHMGIKYYIEFFFYYILRLHYYIMYNLQHIQCILLHAVVSSLNMLCLYFYIKLH